MLLGPFSILFALLSAAISLTILGGGVYFVWGWYQGVLAGIAFLWGGIALIAFSLLGRFFMMSLLGRRRAAADPYMSPDAVVHRIKGAKGSRLYVEQLGVEAGPTLVLTHGLSMNTTAWNYLKQGLAARYRLFVWDVPGFGNSTASATAPYTIETLAEDLQEVVKLTGDGPVVLAGHSMGGMIILTYCRLYRQELGARVAGIVLAQTSFTNPCKTATFHTLLTAIQQPILVPVCYLMIVLSPLLKLINLQSFLSGMLHVNCHFTGYAGVETPQQLDFAARYGITSSPASNARALLAMFRYDATDVLPTLPVPAIVLTADHDLVTLPSAGKVIADAIPGAQRAQLSPSGHLGLFEQYESFTEAVGAWSEECLAGRFIARHST